MLSKIKLEEDYIMKTNFKKIVIVLVIIAIIAGVITYFINKNIKLFVFFLYKNPLLYSNNNISNSRWSI